MAAKLYLLGEGKMMQFASIYPTLSKVIIIVDQKNHDGICLNWLKDTIKIDGLII